MKLRFCFFDRSAGARRIVWTLLIASLGLAMPLTAAQMKKKVEAAEEKTQTPDLVGLSREDVLKYLGKPQSTLRRGDTEILVYANQTRVELREDEVIAFYGKPESVIIAANGTRYTPTARGRVERVSGQNMASDAEQEEGEQEIVAPAAAKTARRPVAAPKPVVAVASTTASDPAAGVPVNSNPASALAEANDEEEAALARLSQLPLAATADGAPLPSVDKYLEDGGILMDEPEPPSKATVLLAFVIEISCRFGFCLLILRISLHWMSMPFYWPDLVKVSALYVVVRDGLHAVGGLGGSFALIRYFRVDDAISFFALALLLFHFKIALSGLTALKVAAATKFATYAVMMGVGLAIAFGLFATA